jgi:hypothetical protein
MELNTYGDLKKVIKAISLKQKGEKIGQIALNSITSFIPGADAAKTTFDFIKAAFNKPDTKKTKTWLDKLDIDDEMSAIVDDTVENGFLKIIAQTIENESDTKPLEQDFNMNAKMVNYLRQKYSGRTISGIQENKNKMKNEALKKLIKEEIKNLFQEDIQANSKPEVKKLIMYLTNSGKMALEQINTPQELDSLLNAVWSGMNDTMKKNSKAIAIKKVIDLKL